MDELAGEQDIQGFIAVLEMHRQECVDAGRYHEAALANVPAGCREEFVVLCSEFCVACYVFLSLQHIVICNSCSCRPKTL